MAKQGKCDFCGRTEELKAGVGLPKGWLTVTERDQASDFGEKPTLHFCGLQCAERWTSAELHARREANGSAAAPVAVGRDATVCPICGEQHSPFDVARGQLPCADGDARRKRDRGE